VFGKILFEGSIYFKSIRINFLWIKIVQIQLTTTDRIGIKKRYFNSFNDVKSSSLKLFSFLKAF